MDFTTFASHMYPYWILGIAVISMVIAAGQKKLLRVEKKPMLHWVRFLVMITLYRMALHYLLKFDGFGGDAHNVSFIPWTVTFTVFWEDACHGLPLFILKKLMGKPSRLKNALYGIALGMVMLSFGLGHVYQGVLPAVLLSFYIPYSIKKGEEYGFGTVMLGHIMYDMVTILSVQYLLK